MTQVLFENARLLDVEAGVLRDGGSVLVEDERIVEVSERTIAPAGAAPRRPRGPHADARADRRARPLRDHHHEPRGDDEQADHARRARGGPHPRRHAAARLHDGARRRRRRLRARAGRRARPDRGPAPVLLGPRALARPAATATSRRARTRRASAPARSTRRASRTWPTASPPCGRPRARSSAAAPRR